MKEDFGYLNQTQLVLVRHGASRATEMQIVGGHIGCTGLSDEGINQVEKLSLRWQIEPPFTSQFPFGAAFSSTMFRAIETGRLALNPLGIELSGSLCGLCEIHPGLADGMTWDEMSTNFGDVEIDKFPHVPIAPKGESWNQMKLRSIDEIRRIVTNHSNQTVILFTHNGVIRAVMESWLGISIPGVISGHANTGITTWIITSEKSGMMTPRLLSFNDFAHLSLLRHS